MSKKNRRRGGSKRKRCISETELDEKWKDIFSRIYFFPTEYKNEAVLSDEELISVLEFLKGKKDELNATKSQLNSIDIIAWRQHTSKMHTCGMIPYYLKREIKAELVTQAWTKFYTILNTFSLINSNDNEGFKSLHLCEAPGAFVASLNHFIQNRYGGDLNWEWTATTLNPYHEGNTLNEMIADDRLIIETLAHWDFGEDFTGNVMSLCNFEYFQQKYHDIDLVTADGSIDCSEDPGEQESHVTPLFLWEVVYALNILKNKGSFVLKIFTTFEKLTVELLYLLWIIFEKVSLIKPGPSKPGNSEVYVICQYFMKEKCFREEIFILMMELVKEKNISLPNCLYRVPKCFITFLKNYVASSCFRQVEAINMNLETFENNNNIENKELRQFIAHRFIDEFNISPIENYLAPLLFMKGPDQKYDKREDVSYKQGSLDERTMQLNQLFLNHINKSKPEKMCSKLYSSSQDSFSIENIVAENCFIFGESIDVINSSSFCSSIFLAQYRTLQAKLSTSVSLINNLKIYMQDKETSAIDFIGIEDEFKLMSNHLPTVTVTYLSEECKQTSINAVDSYLVCLLHLQDTKLQNINKISLFLKHISYNNHFILLLDSLLLTNFWCGIIFIVSSLYETLEYSQLNGSVMIRFCTLKMNELMLAVQHYIGNIKQNLAGVRNGRDVLTSVPLYSLMHSEFRNYVKYKNHSFIKSLLQDDK